MNTRGLLVLGASLIVITCVTSCSRQSPSEQSLTHSQIAGPPALKANARELKATIVTPYLEQKMVAGKNVLWCDTFQLAWNELYDLISEPVQLTPASPMADILNKRAATKADIDETSYVAMAGRLDQGIGQKVKDELQRKFNGQASPELLGLMPKSGWMTYAYLFKTLPFEVAFRHLPFGVQFQGKNVDGFGIEYWENDDPQTEKRGRQVAVLDYRSSGEQFNPSIEEFVVELKTLSQDDRLILAKVSPKRDMVDTIRDVHERIGTGQPTELKEGERLMVPVLNFDLTRDYQEILGRVVKNEPVKTGMPIGVARQSIRFKLDEAGAVLKSEGMMAPGLALPPGVSPRNFIFNKPFLILLQRKDAKNPYFALWVDNPELLVSTDGGG